MIAAQGDNAVSIAFLQLHDALEDAQAARAAVAVIAEKDELGVTVGEVDGCECFLKGI